MSRVTIVRNTTRSCSTLLCFRLCSSACGTRLAVEVRNTAVPGTRTGGLVPMLSMKRSSGIVSSASRSSSIARPRFHVVSSVKTTAPIASGNQPPSGIFSALDARNARSIEAQRHDDRQRRPPAASATSAA